MDEDIASAFFPAPFRSPQARLFRLNPPANDVDPRLSPEAGLILALLLSLGLWCVIWAAISALAGAWLP